MVQALAHYGFAYFAHNVGGGDEIELTNNLNMSVPNSVSFAYWGWDWLLTRIRGGERELIVIKNMSTLVLYGVCVVVVFCCTYSQWDKKI